MNYHNLNKSIRKFDLFQYLENLGVEFNVRSEGGFYYTRCWRCGKNKLYVHAGDADQSKGFWRCWVCGHHGNIFDMIGELEHIEKREAFQKVVGGSSEDYANYKPILELTLDDIKKKEIIKINKPIELPSNFRQIWEFPKDSPGYRYAIRRGLTPDLMRKFDIRYNSLMRRIIFPIYHRGKAVGWQARAISNEMTPKLLSNEGLKKSLLLYGFDNIEKVESIMIVEGPIDAVRGHKHNAVALLGKSLSENQFKLLLRMPHLKQIYIGLDPDARKVAYNMAIRLADIWNVNVMRLPTHKDIGACTEQEVDHYVKISKPYTIRSLL